MSTHTHTHTHARTRTRTHAHAHTHTHQPLEQESLLGFTAMLLGSLVERLPRSYWPGPSAPYCAVLRSYAPSHHLLTHTTHAPFLSLPSFPSLSLSLSSSLSASPPNFLSLFLPLSLPLPLLCVHRCSLIDRWCICTRRTAFIRWRSETKAR